MSSNDSTINLDDSSVLSSTKNSSVLEVSWLYCMFPVSIFKWIFFMSLRLRDDTIVHDFRFRRLVTRAKVWLTSVMTVVTQKERMILQSIPQVRMWTVQVSGTKSSHQIFVIKIKLRNNLKLAPLLYWYFNKLTFCVLSGCIFLEVLLKQFVGNTLDLCKKDLGSSC